MGRHSASYIAAQQALTSGTTVAGAARYVGRVGGLALALGIGVAVAGGAGLAHADGTTDTKTGPTAGADTPSGNPDDGDSDAKTKTRKLGLFNVPKTALGDGGGGLTGRVPNLATLPGSISKLPRQIAGLVAERTVGAGGASTSSPGGRTTPQVSSQGNTRHTAVFSQPGPTTTDDVMKVPQFRSTVDDVVTTPRTNAESLGVVPATPDPTPQGRLNPSSYAATNTAPVTAFAVPVQGAAAQGGLVATTVSGLLAAFDGPSGSGGSPTAPGQLMLGALQLARRQPTTPSLAQGLSLTSISSLLNPTPAPAAPTPPGYPAPTGAVVTPYGTIGKWMIQSNGQVSNYGGQPYQGKTLVEPVNVIIVDPNSKSAAESQAKVNRDMTLAGFPPQPIHSSGFTGFINGKSYSQKPGGLINAYSDNLFIFQNDHGRLFGPAPMAGGGYVYSGAFSTETPTVYNGLPAHSYFSSNMARDALVLRLIATGQVQSVSYVDMGNAYNTDTTTTGDHDGKAVVIVLK